jgi:hypothetical protein
MNRRNIWLAFAGAAILVTGAAQGQTSAPQGQTSAPSRLVAPIRGEALIGYMKPVTKRDGSTITTVIRVKNLSKGPIAGLKVDEFWYDKAGDPVTGDTFRYRMPFLPNEVIEVTLRTPVNPRMDRNQYKFEHANGTVKTELVAKF